MSSADFRWRIIPDVGPETLYPCVEPTKDGWWVDPRLVESAHWDGRTSHTEAELISAFEYLTNSKKNLWPADEWTQDVTQRGRFYLMYWQVTPYIDDHPYGYSEPRLKEPADYEKESPYVKVAWGPLDILASNYDQPRWFASDTSGHQAPLYVWCDAILEVPAPFAAITRMARMPYRFNGALMRANETGTLGVRPRAVIEHSIPQHSVVSVSGNVVTLKDVDPLLVQGLIDALKDPTLEVKFTLYSKVQESTYYLATPTIEYRWLGRYSHGSYDVSAYAPASPATLTAISINKAGEVVLTLSKVEELTSLYAPGGARAAYSTPAFGFLFRPVKGEGYVALFTRVFVHPVVAENLTPQPPAGRDHLGNFYCVLPDGSTVSNAPTTAAKPGSYSRCAAAKRCPAWATIRDLGLYKTDKRVLANLARLMWSPIAVLREGKIEVHDRITALNNLGFEEASRIVSISPVFANGHSFEEEGVTLKSFAQALSPTLGALCFPEANYTLPCQNRYLPHVFTGMAVRAVDGLASMSVIVDKLSWGWWGRPWSTWDQVLPPQTAGKRHYISIENPDAFNPEKPSRLKYEMWSTPVLQANPNGVDDSIRYHPYHVTVQGWTWIFGLYNEHVYNDMLPEGRWMQVGGAYAYEQVGAYTVTLGNPEIRDRDIPGFGDWAVCEAGASPRSGFNRGDWASTLIQKTTGLVAMSEEALFPDYLDPYSEVFLRGKIEGATMYAEGSTLAMLWNDNGEGGGGLSPGSLPWAKAARLGDDYVQAYLLPITLTWLFQQYGPLPCSQSVVDHSADFGLPPGTVLGIAYSWPAADGGTAISYDDVMGTAPSGRGSGPCLLPGPTQLTPTAYRFGRVGGSANRSMYVRNSAITHKKGPADDIWRLNFKAVSLGVGYYDTISYSSVTSVAPQHSRTPLSAAGVLPRGFIAQLRHPLFFTASHVKITDPTTGRLIRPTSLVYSVLLVNQGSGRISHPGGKIRAAYNVNPSVGTVGNDWSYTPVSCGVDTVVAISEDGDWVVCIQVLVSDGCLPQGDGSISEASYAEQGAPRLLFGVSYATFPTNLFEELTINTYAQAVYSGVAGGGETRIDPAHKMKKWEPPELANLRFSYLKADYDRTGVIVLTPWDSDDATSAMLDSSKWDVYVVEVDPAYGGPTNSQVWSVLAIANYATPAYRIKPLATAALTFPQEGSIRTVRLDLRKTTYDLDVSYATSYSPYQAPHGAYGILYLLKGANIGTIVQISYIRPPTYSAPGVPAHPGQTPTSPVAPGQPAGSI